ncbi:MAG TPA: choice-of-anchor D domain-containing protein, partial [Vicinamibacteria bacterium]|nr:choice-of-anchor D domain-containing protein [Vicinamibacteria bacterium]
IGDVGQNAWEEVDFQPAASSGGENYGWRLMEGTHCYEVGNCNQNGSLTLPILEYHHTLGCSVTGGYRYRGSAIPALQGMYVYGDYCHVRIWGALPNPVAGWDSVQLLLAPQAISSFGEDATGELYVVGHAATNGTLYRITEPTAQAGPEIAVSPGSLAFGAQLVAGGPTVPLNLSIRNVGTANLTITGVILGGSNPTPFGVIFDTGQGVLAAGQERTIALDFDPSQLGEHFAQLTILSNDPDEGATEVPLTGLGAVPPTSTVIHCLLNTSVVFAAAETLDAAVCPIVAPGDVTFLAGQRIALWEGISVGSGATFTAGIDPNLRYLTLPKAVVVEE